MLLFTGHKDQNLDAKDRVVIPANFRAVIEAQHEGCVYVVPDETATFLEAYPQKVFEAMAATLVPNRFERGGQRDDKRVFFQSAERLELKGPGRITLPKKFAAYFPSGVVRVAGMNTYLELWDPSRWEAMRLQAVVDPVGGDAGTEG
ncbi:MAG: cell division/cell wall cluster transcriptional repressor MraZ [Planctomycetota bacterium]|nr:cell division/cell wall cluster transcriptional repressor MraZ [Planctomycetota bacterium]